VRTPSGNPNRLAHEKSPYLLQHAYNPVDWHPWGEEAFERARAEDRPVFLSIGYSTCHWCHVMERESFEDAEVAALMNKAFVCIKVDREERPDVDHVYMTACQMMTGSGGWPLTLLLAPDRRPFFAATYLPRAAMLSFVPRVAEAWNENRDAILADATQVTQALEGAMGAARGDMPGVDTLRRGYHELASRFDATHGGFGARPKFPAPHQLLFLLRWWQRSGDATALDMVTRTLEKMRLGGLFDHVGFGFHRYSTDARWFLPHFEKMLYDQALLLRAYTEAYQATGTALFRDTALEIAAYVLRDLSSPEGAFHSAEDADSEGEEGKFYLWSESELRSIAGADADLVCAYFGVEPAGNWLEEASGHRPGTNHLSMPRPHDEAARAAGLAEVELTARIQRVRAALESVRARRVRPHLDDKVLADWNGLMIASLAFAGRALDRADLVDRALRAARFVEATLADGHGGLMHRWRDGEAAIDGMLDDYACFAWAALELYDATFDPHWLSTALAMVRELSVRFGGDAGGGFFMNAAATADLPARPREVYDGAVPSGNSVAAWVLARLSRLTGDMAHDAAAREVAAAFGNQVSRAPSAHTFMLSALDFMLGPTREVVIAGEAGSAEVAAMQRGLAEKFRPSTVVVFRPERDFAPIAALAPYVTDMKALGGAATAYVCRGFACERPVTGVEALMKALESHDQGSA